MGEFAVLVDFELLHRVEIELESFQGYHQVVGQGF